MYYEFIFKNQNGHIEIYLNGTFQFSADTAEEAVKELKGGLLHDYEL